MNKMKETLIFLAIITALTLPTPMSLAKAEDDTLSRNEPAEYMAIDFIVIRPLSLVATAVGSVIFVAALPFSAAGGNTKEAFQKLVQEPAKYTFTRPLGKFEEEY